jgi:hypothetical protein
MISTIYLVVNQPKFRFKNTTRKLLANEYEEYIKISERQLFFAALPCKVFQDVNCQKKIFNL